MTLRRIVMALIVLVVVIQFIPVDRTNPPVVDPVVFTDPNAEAIARKACYDCHSNETVWPWYSYVAPFSWYAISHVNEGRATLNFSDIAGTIANGGMGYRGTNIAFAEEENEGSEGGGSEGGGGEGIGSAAEIVNESAETINEGTMPPAYYTLIHKDAILTAAEKATLIAGLQQALANR